MITTIQIKNKLKDELDKLKDSKKETYEDVITYLMRIADEYKRKQKNLLAEGYKEMARESSRIAKDWRSTETDWD
ncbi:hypothetical protein HY498_02405 [Candidatus Woesearchaeota archaeon]|nr:hypothetical protein [Candidatus Woesearchaeota archaeon]